MKTLLKFFKTKIESAENIQETAITFKELTNQTKTINVSIDNSMTVCQALNIAYPLYPVSELTIITSGKMVNPRDLLFQYVDKNEVNFFTIFHLRGGPGLAIHSELYEKTTKNSHPYSNATIFIIEPANNQIFEYGIEKLHKGKLVYFSHIEYAKYYLKSLAFNGYYVLEAVTSTMDHDRCHPNKMTRPQSCFNNISNYSSDNLEKKYNSRGFLSSLRSVRHKDGIHYTINKVFKINNGTFFGYNTRNGDFLFYGNVNTEDQLFKILYCFFPRVIVYLIQAYVEEFYPLPRENVVLSESKRLPLKPAFFKKYIEDEYAEFKISESYRSNLF